MRAGAAAMPKELIDLAPGVFQRVCQEGLDCGGAPTLEPILHSGNDSLDSSSGSDRGEPAIAFTVAMHAPVRGAHRQIAPIVRPD